jgi:ribose transport system substrate-binding protein
MNRTKLSRSLLVAATISSVALTQGCGSSDESGSDDSGVPVAFVGPTPGSSTWWSAWYNTLEKEAKANNVTLKMVTSDSADSQNLDLNNLVSQKPDGIIFIPIDAKATVTGVTSVADSDIPLITSNSFVDTTYGGKDGKDPKFHTGFSDLAIGELQGEMVKDACADLDPCKVVELTGQLGTSPQIDRSKGLHSVLDKESNVDFIQSQSYGWDKGKATDVMGAVIQGNSDINIVAAQDDNGAIGASIALQENNVHGVKVFGIGGSKEGTAAIADGTLAGTVWVSPVDDAKASLASMLTLLDGGTLDIEDVNGRPTVTVPAVKVDANNVADYPGQW